MKPIEFSQKEHFSFDDLVALVHFLRSPQGCSWDQEQTHESIRRHFIEEAYEVCEGIDKNDNDLLCEELGDMLFQVLFHTDIAEGENAFHLTDVFDGICKKMIRRHPHLFSENENSSEKPNWEELKKAEKGEKTKKDSLRRISTSLPSLIRARKFIEKGNLTSKELATEIAGNAPGADLFRLVESYHKNGLDPEEALNRYLEEIITKCTNYE